jgi:hypothetical protein
MIQKFFCGQPALWLKFTTGRVDIIMSWLKAAIIQHDPVWHFVLGAKNSFFITQ